MSQTSRFWGSQPAPHQLNLGVMAGEKFAGGRGSGGRHLEESWGLERGLDGLK